MAKYIIRLDDACPTMDWDKWYQMEELLDKYEIKPIVGIIPENQDKDFQHDEKGDFWTLCKKWQDKDWSIAQHGLHHLIKPCGKQKFYQKTHEYRSEYAGAPYEEQLLNIETGYEILEKHKIYPTAFFAPAHTYDQQTVRALASFGKRYKYISDGYSLYPFRSDGMIFLPNLFDTPHRWLGKGVLTFVYHPNNMDNAAFAKLEKFIKKNKSDFISAQEALQLFPVRVGQGMTGKIVELILYLIRAVRT